MKKMFFKRTIGLFVIALISVFGLSLSLTKTEVDAYELPSSTQNVIKVTIDTTSEAYKNAVNGLEDDAYVMYATGFLPCAGAADADSPFKDNHYTDWWNAWKDVTISWDFYSPNYLKGMNGVGFRYEWDFTENSKSADQNGFAATSRDETYAAQYANGWVHREVKFEDITDKFMIDVFFTNSILKSELETAGVVEMYYSNITLSYTQGENVYTFDLFGTADSYYTVANINSVANGEAIADGKRVKDFYKLDNWNDVSKLTGDTKSKAINAGLTFEAQEGVDIVKRNAIKVTIDTTSEAYKNAVNGLEDDAYVMYATGFLPCAGAADADSPFKDNHYTDWWNAWKDVTISWDFYSPNYLKGMNGVGFRYEWDFTENSKSADQNGFAATSRDETYAAQYANGWVHREVKFEDITDKFMIDVFFTNSILKSELETAGVVEMYYSNITLSYTQGETVYTFDLFGTADSYYTVANINSVANDEAIADGKRVKDFYKLDNFNDVSKLTGDTKSKAINAGLTFAGVETVPVVATKETKIIKMEEKDSICLTIDTTSEAYKNAVEGLEDTAYVTFGTGLLPLTGSSDQNYAFKNNSLGDWWNEWNDITISYDFFTENYISGMNGVGVQYENSWTFSNNADIVDQNGYNPICRDAAYEAQYENGWVHREFSIPKKDGNFLVDMWLVQAILKSDLDNAGIVKMYYTNIKLSYNNNTYDLFGNENSYFTVEQINCVANGEAAVLGNQVKVDSVVRNGSWDDLKAMTGESASRAVNSVLTFEASHKTPVVASITNSFPQTFVMDAQYDLNSLINCAEKFEIVSITNDNGAVDLTGKDFTNFVFNTIGKNYITVKTTSGNFEAKATFEVIVVDAQTPLFIDADVRAAVPQTAHAHEAITLGGVIALVNGEKTLATTPVVTNSNGDEFTVTASGDNFTFTPTPKVNDTYTVIYKAVNGDYKVDSIEVTITVTDVDKPVVNFDNLGALSIGTNYTVEEIKALISITDISDGAIEIDSISIVDPLGNELTNAVDKFMVKYSGKYKVTVVTKADSDSNVTTAQIEVDGQKSQGLVLGLITDVPEEKRVEGETKDVNVQIWHPDDIIFNVGDVLTYEVMAYTVYDNGDVAFIPGLGAVSGQIDGNYAGLSWPMMHTLFANVESKDVDGNSMARTADLSSYLNDGGNPVWYARSYTVKSGDAIYGAKLYHLTLTFETQAACGSQIVVYYRNIKLADAEGNVKVVLWDGTQAINKEFCEGSLNGSTNVVATLDVAPVPITGKISQTANYGQEFSFSKILMKDAQTDEVLDATVTVTDPKGKSVEIKSGNTSFSFVPTVLGTYNIKVSATNGKYSTEVTYQVTVSDTTDPVVTITTDKTEIYAGDTVKITITMTDDVCNLDTFKEKGYSVKLNGEAVDVTFTQIENGFEATLEVAEGEYSVLAYCTDTVNETVKQFTFNVTTKPVQPEPEKKSGCGSAIISTLLSTIVVLGSAVFFARKKENE